MDNVSGTPTEGLGHAVLDALHHGHLAFADPLTGVVVTPQLWSWGRSLSEVAPEGLCRMILKSAAVLSLFGYASCFCFCLGARATCQIDHLARLLGLSPHTSAPWATCPRSLPNTALGALFLGSCTREDA